LAPPILDPIRGALLRSQPDGRLVAHAREGRERALEEIVRRYRAPLVAFAAMIVPEHRADDVVQESLLRAFDALRASGAEIQLRPWLFRIVRNQALNDIRDTPVSEVLTEELDGVALPEQIAERREEVAALVGGLRALPDAQREAIVARELEGRGHAEIAAELGTSPGAVRQLIFRARATLRGAAGVLIPLPLLRFLIGPGGSEAAGAATAAGVGGAAAATAGGGAATGAAGKVAVGLAGVALAVGGGIAAERGSDRGDRIASAKDGGADALESAGQRSGNGGSSGPGPEGAHGPGDGGGGTSGPSQGDGGRSGPGGGGHDGSSGPGSGRHEDGDDDSSGPGSSGSDHDGSDSSGPGSGDGFDDGELGDDVEGEAELAEIDSSGTSGSDSSGSGTSGSDSSGTSGSGSSGSGSSGSSGSGSSGSGISGSGHSGSSGDPDDDVR
jgi:RNA polymerase sigma factor (sigma-70 family)